MKNNFLIKGLVLCLPVILLGSYFSSSKDTTDGSSVNAATLSGYSAVGENSLPTTIYLKDNTNEEIKSYYSSLAGKNLTGNELLKALKPILSNNQKYFAYDNANTVWKYYEITDRDWTLSPASSTTYGNYDSATNTITDYVYGSSKAVKNNPYLHLLYRNLGEGAGYTKAWEAHGSSGADSNGIDREHVWPKSHGFNEIITGARGDPHHLIAGDHIVNNSHLDVSYGNVSDHDSKTLISTLSYLDGNYKGTSKTKGSGTVFEPQDSDKGDIARACFYMVARYNNLAGTDSTIDSGNPNLSLVSDIVTATGSSTSSQSFSLGILSDLLEWHTLDPVDEYERHRNNLIYNNYGKNRNPFIDYPEWVDSIWGSKSTGADPTKNPFSPSASTTNYEDDTHTTSGGEEIEESTIDKTVFYFSQTDLVNGEKVENFDIDKYTSITSLKATGGTDPAYYDTGTSLRVYANNTLTFNSTRKMTSIAFTFGSGDNSNEITSSTGTFDGTTWTNTSNADKVTFTVGGTKDHRRIKTIVINYESLVHSSYHLEQERDVIPYGTGEGTSNEIINVVESFTNGPDEIVSLDVPLTVAVDSTVLGNVSKHVDYTYDSNELSGDFTFKVTNKDYDFDTNTYTDVIEGSMFPEQPSGITVNTYRDVVFSGGSLNASYSAYMTYAAKNNWHIQIRDNNNSGIVATQSSMLIKSVSVVWNEGNTGTYNKSIKIYGKNEPYTSAAELYDTKTTGTLLGTINAVDRPTDVSEIFATPMYKYIGIKAGNGASYLDQITITYEGVVSVLDQATSYANYFLSKTGPICSAGENNATALGEVWPTLAEEFSFMAEEAKTLFETDSTITAIANARTRLEYILQKYSSLDNYTSISIVRSSGFNIRFTSILTDSEGNINKTSIIIMICLTVCSVSAIIYARSRRKK